MDYRGFWGSGDEFIENVAFNLTGRGAKELVLIYELGLG